MILRNETAQAIVSRMTVVGYYHDSCSVVQSHAQDRIPRQYRSTKRCSIRYFFQDSRLVRLIHSLLHRRVYFPRSQSIHSSIHSFLFLWLVFAFLLVGRAVVARSRNWLVLILVVLGSSSSSSLDKTGLFHDKLDTTTQKDVIDLTDDGHSGTHATQSGPFKVPPTEIAQ
jgi:hypothetical protein